LVNVAVLYSQGWGQVLFLRHRQLRRTVEFCNQLPVHPRHPYVLGILVVHVFLRSPSGRAIKKTFQRVSIQMYGFIPSYRPQRCRPQL
jgi:2-isopropylmalate synthase